MNSIDKKNRKCKDCSKYIIYIPKKVRCIECYKKYINKSYINDIDLFISDD